MERILKSQMDNADDVVYFELQRPLDKLAFLREVLQCGTPVLDEVFNYKGLGAILEDIEEEVVACGKKIDELYKEDGEGKDEKPMIPIPRISNLTPELVNRLNEVQDAWPEVISLCDKIKAKKAKKKAAVAGKGEPC